MGEQPRIYVACLASYNAGRLHGRWVDVDGDSGDVWREIRRILRESPRPNVVMSDWECLDCGHEWPRQAGGVEREAVEVCAECESRNTASGPQYPSAEEWAIHDYEGWGGYSVHEHDSIDQLCWLAAMIAIHGEVASRLVDHVGGLGFATELNTLLDDRYYGEWSSFEDYCQHYIDDCALELPAWAAPYFDLEAYARDVLLSGDMFTVETADGQVHVFSGH